MRQLILVMLLMTSAVMAQQGGIYNRSFEEMYPRAYAAPAHGDVLEVRIVNLAWEERTSTISPNAGQRIVTLLPQWVQVTIVTPWKTIRFQKSFYLYKASRKFILILPDFEGSVYVESEYPVVATVRSNESAEAVILKEFELIVRR